MTKTIILITAIFLFNGCTTSLPTVSDKSSAMLQQSQWEPINAQNTKGNVK